MYYLYKRNKSLALPSFNYSFKGFEEFYELAKVIDVPLEGVYYINIKTDSYKDLIDFLNQVHNFGLLVIYVETTESLLRYIKLKRPNVQILDAKSNWEIYEELITKHEVLFKHNCTKLLYNAIPHTYEDINAALAELKQLFPDREIGEKEIGSLYPIDDNIYPRQVLISFLKMDRYRWSRLDKCLMTFGNDLTLFAMRNNCKKLFESKIKYYKTGEGDYLIKTIPWQNIVQMHRALTYDRKGFMDVRTILELYMKGETVNDYLQERTNPYSDD